MGDLSMQWYDWVRLGTIVLSVATMYFLGLAWLQRNRAYSMRLKDFWWAMNAMLFSLIIFNLENILKDREPTPALFVFFLSSLVALKASMNKKHTLFKSNKGN